MNGRSPTLHVLLERLTGKVDTVLSSQEEFKTEITHVKTELTNMKTDIIQLKAEDTRIDNRVTLTVSVSKAYMAGLASAFTFLGTVFGAAGAYIFGIKP